jgi:DNA-binding winged helix-turn-helix (wHTH) protein
MEKHYSLVRFDWHHERVTRGDVTVRVSGQEKVLLRLMVEGAPRLCTREQLMSEIWGPRAALMDELYLTQLIYRLRKSLRPLGLGNHIETVPRTGYRFMPDGLRCELDEPGTSTSPKPQEPVIEPTGGVPGPSQRPLVCLRRRAHNAGPLPEQIDLPSIDPDRGLVSYAGATAYLTRFELTLLEVLIEQADTVVGREALMARLWPDEQQVGLNRLTRLVSRLRRSLEPLGVERQVQFVACTGYRFSRTAGPPATHANTNTHCGSLVDTVLYWPGAWLCGLRASAQLACRMTLDAWRKWLDLWRMWRAAWRQPLTRFVNLRRSSRLVSRRSATLAGMALAVSISIAAPVQLEQLSREQQSSVGEQQSSIGEPRPSVDERGSCVAADGRDPPHPSCSAEFIHEVFVRDLSAVSASSLTAGRDFVELAWARISADLQAAGCRGAAARARDVCANASLSDRRPSRTAVLSSPPGRQ